MDAMSGGVTAGHGPRAAPVTAATHHDGAAVAGRNRQWDPPGGTGG
jgi:hypothetical protein